MAAPNESQELNSYDSADVADDDQVIFSDADDSDIIKRDSAKKLAKLSSLQDSYDKGKEIKIADADGESALPVNVISPDAAAAPEGEYDPVATSYNPGDTVTVTTSIVLTWRNVVAIIAPAGPFDQTEWELLSPNFQSVLQTKDLAGNVTSKSQGGGEFEQAPYNLETRAIVDQGDNGALLQEPTNLDIESRTIFVDNHGATDGIEIFSIANGDKPEHIGLIEDALLQNPRKFIRSGDILYVVDTSGIPTLLLFDVGNTADVKLLNPGGFPTGVGGVEFDGNTVMKIQGKYLFLTRRGSSAATSFLTILDISDPTNILLVAVIADQTDNGDGPISLDRPEAIDIDKNFLFVANEISNSIELIDISGIGDVDFLPQFISTITDNGGDTRIAAPERIHATNDVLHVISQTNKTLQAIDYRTPATPVPRGQLLNAFGSSFLVDSVIGGRYLYVLGSVGVDKFITSVDLQDADNLIKLGDSIIAGAGSLTPSAIGISGDHIYAIGTGEGEGQLYSMRLSGVDLASGKIGSIRAGILHVKDMFTSRVGQFTEALTVGTRGLLVNGPIVGQKGSKIKRPTTTVIRTGEVVTPIILDMSQDISIYIIDLTGSASGVWPIDVINQRPGNKILIKVLLTPFDADAIFSDPKFAVDTGNTDTMSVDGDLAVLECVLDDDSADSIIATVTEIA